MQISAPEGLSGAHMGGVLGPKKYNKSVANNSIVVYTQTMNASELRRWLKKQNCTFESHKGGSGHITVRCGAKTSQLPVHGGKKEELIMLAYPIRLTKDDNGTVLATSRDFPELTTFGKDRADALRHAIGALEEAIAARIANREDIPLPSAGRSKATLPAQTALKVLLYREARKRGVRKADLARRLHWHGPQVDRLFDLRHASRLDQMEAAFGALDLQISVEVEKRSGRRA